MDDFLFEPNLENSKYKMQLIIYFAFISIILISLISYGAIILAKGEWKQHFELKEIKCIKTAAIGKESQENKNEINIDYINDFFFNFNNKENKIKKIILKDVELEKNGEINLYKLKNEKDVLIEKATDLQKTNKLEYIVPSDQNEIIVPIRVKVNDISKLYVEHSTEIKSSLNLLKDKVNQDTINKQKYKLKFNIIVELEKGKKYKSQFEYTSDDIINVEKEIDINYLDNNIKFKKE